MPVTVLVAPGSARHERDAAATGDAREAVGHVDGALLVARQDRADLLGVVERIEDREHHASGIAEEQVHPLEFERTHQRLRSCHAFTHDSTAPLSALETSLA